MNPAAAAAIFAGASLIGTSAEKMSRAINTWRNVTIQISNYSNNYTLEEPQIYTCSGYCHNPPQPTIKKNTQEVCSFSKTANTACGAVGVLTYKIRYDENEPITQLAIMFSVPYNYNHYKNWFALGIFESKCSCDKELYRTMYYNEPGTFNRAIGTGNSIKYSNGNVLLKGTMSPLGQSVIKVEFWDTPDAGVNVQPQNDQQ